MKQEIISEINEKLESMGITMRQGDGTDITITTEFLDAGWSTGKKKISYEASVFANEQNKVVYMYEKTMEIGQGFSFGGESDTSFQSGTTVFRKVKNVQYGPDGKAFEYTLDLGAIPKAVKETAKHHGWDFKIVINKTKAMYPVGYEPANNQFAQPPRQAEQRGTPKNGYCSNCGMPMKMEERFCSHCGASNGSPSVQVPPPEQTQADTRPAYDNPQGTFYVNTPQKVKSKGATLGLVAFILLGVGVGAMLLFAKGSLFGWIFSAVLFAAAFFIQRKIAKRGCLLQIILWVVTAFILLIGLTMFTAEDIDITTAKIKNAQMTTEIDEGGKPMDTVRTYSPDAPQLIAAAELRNAPQHTQVKFVWYYVTGEILITEHTIDSGENEPDIYVFSYITNETPWPEGEYMVEIYVEGRESPDDTVRFTIVSDAAAAEALPKSLAILLPDDKSFPLAQLFPWADYTLT